jgi:hypothetical protein
VTVVWSRSTATAGASTTRRRWRPVVPGGNRTVGGELRNLDGLGRRRPGPQGLRVVVQVSVLLELADGFVLAVGEKSEPRAQIP